MNITVIQPITTKGDLTRDEVQSLSQNGLMVSIRTLNFGPSSIESRVDNAFAVPEMIAIAQREEKLGAKALVIDCATDTGLATLREVVDIPVLGVAQTSMAICASLADSFGVITILNQTVPMIKELVDLYGHKGRCVGCRSVDVPSLEVKSRIGVVKDRLAAEALQLVKDEGADAIMLGCTGFIGCAEAISNRLRSEGFNVPVVDPLPATVFSTIPLIHLNLTHSRKSFPKHDAKPLIGYDFLEQAILK